LSYVEENFPKNLVVEGHFLLSKCFHLPFFISGLEELPVVEEVPMPLLRLFFISGLEELLVVEEVAMPLLSLFFISGLEELPVVEEVAMPFLSLDWKSYPWWKKWQCLYFKYLL
jgi:hypothetical protein